MTVANMTLQYPGGAARTITSKNFSSANKRAFLRANLVSLRHYFDTVNDFPALAASTPAALVPAQTVHGARTTARIHYAQARTPRAGKPAVNPPTAGHRPVSARLLDHRAHVKAAVTKALEWIDQSQTLTFPNDTIDIFCAEENQYSLGYRWMVANGTQQGAAILLGKTAVTWSGTAQTKTVAQECYEHYKSAWTVSAMERRIMATLIHEMGHVFHQMSNLVHYITLARVEEMYQLGNPATNANYADLVNAPGQADLSNFRRASGDFGYGTSLYAGGSCLNEFVAEIFCALVMGAPIGADEHSQSSQLMAMGATRAEVLTAYTECGGPMPEQAVMHARG